MKDTILTANPALVLLGKSLPELTNDNTLWNQPEGVGLWSH